MSEHPINEGDTVEVDSIGVVVGSEKKNGEWWYVVEVAESLVELRETEVST